MRNNKHMDPKELPPNVRDDKISEETKKLTSSLPSHTDSQGQKLCKYQGCWYYYNTLQGVLNFQRDGIFVAGCISLSTRIDGWKMNEDGTGFAGCVSLSRSIGGWKWDDGHHKAL
ncbi:hypothetical protein YC2023_051627 [Brassica napus]